MYALKFWNCCGLMIKWLNFWWGNSITCRHTGISFLPFCYPGVSHLLVKCWDVSLLPHSFRRSLWVSVKGFVSDPSRSVLFLQVFFGKLYDGIFVTGLVVTKVNYVILKIVGWLMEWLRERGVGGCWVHGSELPDCEILYTRLWRMFFFLKKKKVFIWLCWVLAVVRGIFVGSCGIFCCSPWTLCSVPGLRICGSWTSLLCDTWDLSSPAKDWTWVSLLSQGRLLTTGPPGKSLENIPMSFISRV